MNWILQSQDGGHAMAMNITVFLLVNMMEFKFKCNYGVLNGTRENVTPYEWK
jgi:hypothetical protein